jgi:hypothetical protein
LILLKITAWTETWVGKRGGIMCRAAPTTIKARTGEVALTYCF